MTHNKNRNPLLNLLINCKLSTRSVPQILSIKDDYASYLKFSNNWFV